MERFAIGIGILLLLALIVPVAAAPAATMVSGDGKVLWPDTADDTYGFTAQADEFGNAKGHATFQHRDTGDTAEQGNIQCVSVVGNTAYLSGTETHS